MSEKDQAEAFIAALAAAGAVPFELGKVPTPTPAFYTEVTVSRRFGVIGRSSVPTTTLYRATTRVVAQSVANAREQRRRVALVEGVLLGGVDSTPVAFESEDPIGPDDGWFSGLTTWTWAS